MGPPIHVVLLAFVTVTLSYVLAFALPLWGTRGRAGARGGLLVGGLVSVPVGFLAGLFLWSLLEEVLPLRDEFALTLGLLAGCFLVTLGINLLAMRIGALIAAAATREQRK